MRVTVSEADVGGSTSGVARQARGLTPVVQSVCVEFVGRNQLLALELARNNIDSEHSTRGRSQGPTISKGCMPIFASIRLG